MADIDIGGGDGGSGGVGGIPTKYLVMGGGALLVGGLLLYSQSKGGGGSSSQSAGTNQTLGPNASIALGTLDTDLRQQVGDMEQLFTKQANDLAGSVGGISSQLTGVSGDLNTHLNDLATGQSQLYNQAAANSANLGQAIWQTFMRASNPQWMPGGPDDPWTSTENQAQHSMATTT
jgi:hypothetical protein